MISILDLALGSSGLPEGEGQPPAVHSADQNGDGAISLTELLRLIQIYNARLPRLPGSGHGRQVLSGIGISARGSENGRAGVPASREWTNV
jgi:hypothetical protein